MSTYDTYNSYNMPQSFRTFGAAQYKSEFSRKFWYWFDVLPDGWKMFIIVATCISIFIIVIVIIYYISYGIDKLMQKINGSKRNNHVSVA